MKKSMSELVAGINKNPKAKEYAKASEWPNCCHTGCPLPTTIKADNPTCTYHYKEYGLSSTCITEAIKEFEGYIKKHNQMIFWDVRQWKQQRASIMGWPVLPAEKEEMDLPTLYLKRFKAWIDKSIKERAEELYQGH